MVYRLRSPSFARHFDADLRTLLDRKAAWSARFGDRLVALDRIAGTAAIAGAMLFSVSLLSQAAGMGLFDIPSAAANNDSTLEATAGDAADRLSWSHVRDLQLCLAGLGFEPGTADGMAGKRTLAALNRYRAAHGMAEAAYVDRTTIADLLD